MPPKAEVKRKEVILLPPGPIRTTVEGSSGQIYEQVLHDDKTGITQKVEPTVVLPPYEE